MLRSRYILFFCENLQTFHNALKKLSFPCFFCTSDISAFKTIAKEQNSKNKVDTFVRDVHALPQYLTISATSNTYS